MSSLLYRKVYPRKKAEEVSVATEPNQNESTFNGISAKEFFNNLEASITLAPLPEREEGAKRFIQSAMEISGFYELDIEIRRLDSCISVDLTFDIGAELKGLNKVFAMADKFGFNTKNEGMNVIVTLEYYTHAVYLKGRQIAP